MTDTPSNDLHAVTGAFGYSGKYIAHRLLAEGKAVTTLTNSVHRENPFGDRVRVSPFDFDRPERLTDSLDRHYTSELARRVDRVQAYRSN